MTAPPLRLLDHLPGRYWDDHGGPVLSGLLAAFDELLAGLYAEIHGTNGAGGIPDLWDPATTPPPQLPSEQQRSDDYAFLALIAAWLDLPLRPPPSRDADWNRAFLTTVLDPEHGVLDRRGTLHSLDTMLRDWLAGEAVDNLSVLITDLASHANAAPSAFQLDVTATLGVDTVLGEGPAGYFIVDVVLNEDTTAKTGAIDVCGRAVRQLLDSERPAHTTYQVRLRDTTGQVHAQLEGPAP